MDKKIYKTVAVPVERVNIEALTWILDRWGAIFKKALGCARVDFYIGKTENIPTAFFPWWEDGLTDDKRTSVYKLFTEKLCDWSKQKFKAIYAPSSDDELYEFQSLLAALGLVGDEWAHERRILCEGFIVNGSKR